MYLQVERKAYAIPKSHHWPGLRTRSTLDSHIYVHVLVLQARSAGITLGVPSLSAGLRVGAGATGLDFDVRVVATALALHTPTSHLNSHMNMEITYTVPACLFGPRLPYYVLPCNVIWISIASLDLFASWLQAGCGCVHTSTIHGPSCRINSVVQRLQKAPSPRYWCVVRDA